MGKKRRDASIREGRNAYPLRAYSEDLRGCSPQHMHRRLLETVFNGDTFDYSFTLVRHPVERFVSEYKFQVAASKRPDFAPIAEWIEDTPHEAA